MAERNAPGKRMTLRAALVNHRSANSVPLCGEARKIARLKLGISLRIKRCDTMGIFLYLFN